MALRLVFALLSITTLLLVQDHSSETKIRFNVAHNCGHKGGYDCMKELPENSLALLNHLGEQQTHPRFKYLEFDIRETKDKQLVVFHDPIIGRMLPNRGYNVEVYKKMASASYSANAAVPRFKPRFFWKVSDLTLAQLQGLTLEGRVPGSYHLDKKLYVVPTLSEYVEKLKGKLSKPIVFDIKSLISLEGQNEFERVLINYTDFIDGNKPSSTRYNAFPYQQVSVINLTGLMNNFENVSLLCLKLESADIEIYRGWLHDSLCDFHYRKDLESQHNFFFNWAIKAISRVSIKHHVILPETQLDPANYYEPRLVHLEPGTSTTPHRFVYTPIASADTVLSRLREINNKNLIVFLHGRGRHPEKGEKQLLDFSKKYNAALLMFDWDSWICKSYCKELVKAISTKHPYANAEAAAPGFAKLLEQIQVLKRNNPRLRITILAHSMGNIVLKEAVSKDHLTLKAQPGIFIDNLIINSADVALKNHKTWLESISFSKEIFITMSRGDFALGSVELMLQIPLLGQGFRGNTPSTSFASNAHYLDFTDVSMSHRKFGTCDSLLRKIVIYGMCIPALQNFFTSAFSDDNWENCTKGVARTMGNFRYDCVKSR